MARTILALLFVLTCAPIAIAQESRVSVGGTVALVAQTHADDQPLGGTSLGGSALLGVWVSRRVAIEFEPSFGDSYSQQYSYRPFASATATVVASRRDIYFPVQARIRAGVLEPVVGVAFSHSTIERHATFDNGTTYFDDDRSGHDLLLVGGLDLAFRVAPNVYLVPTFRALVGQRGFGQSEAGSVGDPLGDQTSTGSFTFRFGIGARVEF